MQEETLIAEYEEKIKTHKENLKVFLNEIVQISKKHGFSLSHEDGHGAFIIERYNERYTEWLMAAFDANDLDTERRDFLKRQRV